MSEHTHGGKVEPKFSLWRFLLVNVISLAGLCLPDRHALGQTDWFAPPGDET